MGGTPHPASCFSPGLCSSVSHYSGSSWPGARAGWDMRVAGRQVGRPTLASTGGGFSSTPTRALGSQSTHPGTRPVNPEARSRLPIPSGSWAASATITHPWEPGRKKRAACLHPPGPGEPARLPPGKGDMA